MRRGLLFCGGIILGLVAVSILGEGPDLFAKEKTWFSADCLRIISLSLIAQGAAAASGAALCVGRAFSPLTFVPAQSGTIVSGPESATIGGGPVLPICGILFLYAAFMLFVSARASAEEIEGLESVSRQMRDEPVDPHHQSRDELVDHYRRRERTERSFGVLWLIVGGMLLGTPLFLKPRVWQLRCRINGTGGAIAIGGLLLSGMSLGVWRANGTFLKGAYEFFSLVGLFGVLVGAIVTVLGSIMAVARDRPRD